MSTTTGQWERFESAEQGQNELGAFYALREAGLSQPGKAMTFARTDSFSTDGVVVRVVAHASKSGAIGPINRHAVWYPHPGLWLGRAVSYLGKKPLGELLLDSPDLTIARPEDERGVVRLLGTVMTGGWVARVLVDVDTRRSFMPVRIESRDSLFDFPVEIMVTTRTEEHRGIPIPVEGTRETFTCCGPDNGKFQLVEAELKKAGVVPEDTAGWRPDVFDAAVREAYRLAIRNVFGDAGVPYLRMELTPQRLVKTEVRSVNSLIPPSKFVCVFPEGFSWDDKFTDTDGTGKPIDEPDEERSGESREHGKRP